MSVVSTPRCGSALSSFASKMSLRSLFLMLGVMVAVASAHAATWTVTTLADSNDASCATTCSLRDAITAAASGDTIDFSGAGATGTITLGSTLTLSKEVTITGPGANLLTISGNNAVTVFIVNSGVTASISGITIANGGNTNGCSGNDCGGILNNGTLTVSNSTVSNNTGYGFAGGIDNSGTLTVSNSTFSGNSATNGGGIANSGTLTVSNSTFSGNTAPLGGGIYSYSQITLSNSIVAGNTDSSTTGDDCDGCTSNGSNLISTPTNIINPLLGPLQNNGGPTQTMLPQTGSPALAAGSGSTLATGAAFLGPLEVAASAIWARCRRAKSL